MKKIILFITLLINIIAFSQNPGDLDPNFSGVKFIPDFNFEVNTTATQPDGNILVGGNFTSYSGMPENRIIRIEKYGDKDLSFNTGTGFNGSVRVLKIQPDGKILVGGDFTSYNGIIQNKIIRLNNDGSIDTSFNIGTGFDAAVNTITQQSDGKILVGGNFVSYNGIITNYLIRLNGDGTKDASFNSGGIGFNSRVNTIVQQPDGKILVGGTFASYNGGSCSNIIRINSDGPYDISFNTGFAASDTIGVLTIVLQPDGKILMGGKGGFLRLTSNGGQNCLINSQGVFACSYNTPVDNPLCDLNIVSTIILQPDGKIILGGSTYYCGGKKPSYHHLVRIKSDYTLDTSFNAGPFDTSFNTAEVEPDGTILLGGNLSSLDGKTSLFKRLKSDGSNDGSLHSYSGFDGVVLTSTLQSDGKVLVGGDFTSYNGVPRNRIVRLNTDGKLDFTFNTGTGFNYNVNTVLSQTDGKILVGGFFNSYNGINQNSITRLNSNGTKDAAFNIGTGFFGEVYTLALQSDGKILAGGWFNSYNGQPHNTIIRLNSDGTKDTSFNIGIGVDTYVNSIVLQPDGKILVSLSEGVLIRLNSDGTRDNTFNIGSGYLNTAFDNIVLQPDGKIIVNYLTRINYTLTQSGIIRLNSDGTKDSSFNSIIWDNANTNTFSIALQSDGKILVGGDFTSYKGINTYGSLIRFNGDGTKDTTFTLSSSVLGMVYTIILQPDTTILLGGAFTNQSNLDFPEYPESFANSFTRLKGDSTLSSIDFEKNDLKIYPNPVKNLFSITGNETINQIEIFDLLGKRVFVKKETQENINISFLPKGIYILKITGNKGVSSFKIIKE